MNEIICPNCEAPVGWLDARCEQCKLELVVDAFCRAMHKIEEDETPGHERPRNRETGP
jgi:predicted amidophosphoribosyltransferase